jgi:pyruvate,orthophosphate dikinase
MGRKLGEPGRPAAGVGPLRRQVLHARDDGDRPQHRPQRRVRARAWPKQAGNERFAWDSYRRLIQMFGKTVLGVDGELFEHASTTPRTSQGRDGRPRPGRRPTCALSRRSRRSSATDRREDFPQDPREQLDLAIRAVFDSWNADRARALPPPGAHPGRPRHRGQRPGDGLRQPRRPTPAPASPSPATRPPASAACTATTCQRPGRGRRRRHPQHRAAGGPGAARPDVVRRAADHHGDVGDHYRDLCDIEFTIERGKLWMLQTRVGKRTAGGRVPHRRQLVDEG